MLRSVIQDGRVTSSASEGPVSVRLDPVLMRAAELLRFEEVEVVNVATAERWRTYVGTGAPGEIHMHTGDRHPTRSGDVVHILSWGMLHDGQTLTHHVKLVALDERNQVISLSES
ncbi:MAG: aspartate 1-decarboxylase [Acidobacteriota bacterium]